MKLGLPPGYVLDKMEFYEISALLKFQYLKDKETWEQTRMAGFITARSNGAKVNKVENLLQFPWEKPEKKKTEPVFMTDEQIEQFRKKAQAIIENERLQQE